MQFTEQLHILGVYNVRHQTCKHQLAWKICIFCFWFLFWFAFLGVCGCNFSSVDLQKISMFLTQLEVWRCFWQMFFSHTLKRFLDTYWKTEWHSVCREAHLMPHQNGEGFNSKRFGTCKTLWVTVTHNVFQSTMKPLCSMDRHFWMEENGAMTKKKKS